MAFIYDLADTWNDNGTTFTAIKMNVTDTDSASGSLLMDLQVGGSSKFSVSKLGDISFRGHTLTSDATAICLTNSNGVRTLISRIDYTIIPQASSLSWGNLTSFGVDLSLFRDNAADTFGQRRGTNPQTFNIYNTYNSSTIHERGFLRWNSNVFEIGAEAGTSGGTNRNLRLYANQTKVDGPGGSGYVNFFSGNTPQVIIQQSTGLSTLITPLSYSIPESTSAPAGTANKATIFAEDDGAGKTRLMVQFGTGAAQQIAIEP